MSSRYLQTGTMSTGPIRGLLARHQLRSAAGWSQPLSFHDSNQERGGRETHLVLLPKCQSLAMLVRLFGLMSAITQAEDTCPSSL